MTLRFGKVSIRFRWPVVVERAGVDISGFRAAVPVNSGVRFVGSAPPDYGFATPGETVELMPWGLTWPIGEAPSDVNDSARRLMADVRTFKDRNK
jgi:hypothetical protein